jgi:hypothetical protein
MLRQAQHEGQFSNLILSLTKDDGGGVTQKLKKAPKNFVAEGAPATFGLR